MCTVLLGCPGTKMSEGAGGELLAALDLQCWLDSLLNFCQRQLLEPRACLFPAGFFSNAPSCEGRNAV